MMARIQLCHANQIVSFFLSKTPETERIQLAFTHHVTPIIFMLCWTKLMDIDQLSDITFK